MIAIVILLIIVFSGCILACFITYFSCLEDAAFNSEPLQIKHETNKQVTSLEI